MPCKTAFPLQPLQTGTWQNVFEMKKLKPALHISFWSSPEVLLGFQPLVLPTAISGFGPWGLWPQSVLELVPVECREPLPTKKRSVPSAPSRSALSKSSPLFSTGFPKVTFAAHFKAWDLSHS